MARCAVLLLVALMACLPVWADPAKPDHIHVASEAWEGHTHADGTGLAWDILRLVFEPAGVSLKIQSVPYMRSIGLVQRRQADAWVGSYLNEVDDGVFYPREPYDADQIVALGLIGKPVPTMETLGQYRLAWMRGYEYQRYLPNLHQYREVLSSEGILGMLTQGRADFYLDARTEVEDVLRLASEPQNYRVTELIWLPIYLGFADTPRGRELAAIYDRRLELLKQGDALREIFERWQQPYPFE
jgi:polar amino acid transport system substrate-binding protein